MKLKSSFFYTLREDSKDEDSVSSNLLVKAGMMKKISAGIYMFMPLGLKVKDKIENIIREEMNNSGAQELLMPALIPEEEFIKSGRREAFGKDMFTLKDRYDRPYALGPTHEELFVNAATSKIKSYRDMPFNIYQIQDKFRDEIRPRYGLIRVREFTMKDAYSFDKDKEGLKISYDKMKQAYINMFDRMNINYRIVEADGGVMSDNLSEEFHAITDVGEDTLVLCETCDFASNTEVASVISKDINQEKPKTKEIINTPNVKTIDEVVNFLKVDESKTVKTLVYNVDGEVILCLVKGNRELNEVKLRKLLQADRLEMATEEELKSITDADFGSLGPIGISNKIVIDSEVKQMTNFVVGANKTDYHYINVNLTDFEVCISGDIVTIEEGDICPKCGKNIHFKKGIEIGNIFDLGTKYSENLDLRYADENNQLEYVHMGCYGIGPARCMASIVEQNNDDKGIIWPVAIAPYQVGIILIDDKNNEVANELYDTLNKNGIEALLDDRNERAGVKFNDMDLIGIPIKITIGKKINEGLVELKTRDGKIDMEVPLKEIINKIKEII